ncbi:MAG: LysR family transcriptional regulator [Cohaesibacter sp.]|jgi:DNA-binding transcriptional LysR family regulator|nr:LysR family transcriptional regulator [Cohaesibacter sp.]
METKWLSDFLVLARTGSFSQAAEERFVTQSAFSRRIKALESWLGADLFDRRTFPVTLTPEGHSFYDTAESIVNELNQNRADFQRLSEQHQPDIRLSAASTLAISFVPQWLDQLRRALSDFTVGVHTHDFFEMVQLLSDRKMDFVLQFSHPEIPMFFESHRFDAIKLGKDVLHLLSPCDASGTALYDLEQPEKQDLDYIGYAQTGYFNKVENLLLSRLGSHAPAFRRYSESGTCEFIKQMALVDKKLCWLPNCSAYEEIRAEKLKPVGNQSFDMDLEIWIYKNRDAPSPLVQSIWSVLEENPCIDHLVEMAAPHLAPEQVSVPE